MVFFAIEVIIVVVFLWEKTFWFYSFQNNGDTAFIKIGGKFSPLELTWLDMLADNMGGLFEQNSLVCLQRLGHLEEGEILFLPGDLSALLRSSFPVDHTSNIGLKFSDCIKWQ